jgi:hypothetical protein
MSEGEIVNGVGTCDFTCPVCSKQATGSSHRTAVSRESEDGRVWYSAPPGWYVTLEPRAMCEELLHVCSIQCVKRMDSY